MTKLYETDDGMLINTDYIAIIGPIRNDYLGGYTKSYFFCIWMVGNWMVGNEGENATYLFRFKTKIEANNDRNAIISTMNRLDG
jgi:hypothetical protein